VRHLSVLLLAAFVCAATAAAQDLEPRAYSPSPVGMNIALLSYLYSSGGVVTDPSVPIQNIDAKINTAVLYYGRTFGLLGRSANASVILPYVWGKVAGDVFEEHREITRSGAGDQRLRLAVNLFGTPALSPQEFAARRPQTTLGASLTIGVPLGQYNRAHLINLGANRWAFKPELGLSHPLGPLDGPGLLGQA
jgi:hypothetical protein